MSSSVPDILPNAAPSAAPAAPPAAPRIERFWRAEEQTDWAEEAVALGLAAAHLVACGADDARAEAARLAELGFTAQNLAKRDLSAQKLAKPSAEQGADQGAGQGTAQGTEQHANQGAYRGFDPRLPVFQQAALAAGAISAPCPCCGKPLASRESYPVFINAFDQPVFYRFACCAEFFLIAAKSPQAKVALWLPAHELVVSFVEYRRFPHNHDYYGPAQFAEWLKLFHRLAAEHPALVAKYSAAQASTRRTALALGFVFNFGHHVSDELSALPFVPALTAGRAPVAVLGPFDFFDAGGVFAAELGPAPLCVEPLRAPASLRGEPLRVEAQGAATPPALFRLALEQNLFITRLSHTAPLQETVARRLVDAAGERCTPEFLHRAQQSAQHRPLAWVTLRSHNRAWRGQAHGLAQVLNALRREHPGLGVVFDGLEAERPLLAEALALLEPGLPAYDGLGTSLFEALAWAGQADFFIAPFGNGTGFTSIANIPGVVHTHEEWAKAEPFCINRRENCALALPVTGQTIATPGEDIYSADYELDWREVLHAARLVLTGLQG